MAENMFASFKAILVLYDKEHGGRYTPIKSGFRTDIEFKDEVRFSIIKFEQDSLCPGSESEVTIDLYLHGDDEVSYFSKREKCKVLEGSFNIGEIKGFRLLETEYL